LLNSFGIAALSVVHKTLLAGTAVHKAMLACGVILLTDCVLIGLGFIPSVGLSVAADLARRDLAVFDESSRFFLARNL
jgi:hypothetical protein